MALFSILVILPIDLSVVMKILLFIFLKDQLCVTTLISLYKLETHQPCSF